MLDRSRTPANWPPMTLHIDVVGVRADCTVTMVPDVLPERGVHSTMVTRTPLPRCQRAGTSQGRLSLFVAVTRSRSSARHLFASVMTPCHVTRRLIAAKSIGYGVRDANIFCCATHPGPWLTRSDYRLMIVTATSVSRASEARDHSNDSLMSSSASSWVNPTRCG